MKKIVDVYLFEFSTERTLHELIYETKNYTGTVILAPDVCFYESPVIKVYLRREETDREYTDRLKHEKSKMKLQEERELAEYKRLRAKFEGVV